MADATYHFLSFVRSGFAASITQPDTFGAGQPALARAPVGVSVSGVATPVTHQAVVRGPGDVVGLSASQVVRTDPIDGAVGVEPNYFAQIEFDRPDLPWLFTPAAAAGERLRPWLVLVVVDLDGPHPCALSNASPLPQLRVPADAASQLPDLAASYLWAHAQVVTPDGQTVSAALDGRPAALELTAACAPVIWSRFAGTSPRSCPRSRWGALRGWASPSPATTRPGSTRRGGPAPRSCCPSTTRSASGPERRRTSSRWRASSRAGPCRPASARDRSTCPARGPGCLRSRSRPTRMTGGRSSGSMGRCGPWTPIHCRSEIPRPTRPSGRA